MRAAYDVEAVRAAEAAAMAHLPAGTLMARAAAGLAATCARQLGGVYARRVVLLVGSGDNGGDALYAGALLAGRGARVDALLVSGRGHEGGLAALQAAGGRVANDPRILDVADLVLDGIVGIGGRAGLRPDAAALVARADGALVVAVDVPSGVDAGTGTVAGDAVRADVTVTFGAYKPGLVVDPGAERAGAVELVDIGITEHLPSPRVQLLQAADVAARLPTPGAESDKYRRGVLGVVAGSARYPGAAVLTTGAALRGGAGMVRFAGVSGPSGPAAQVRARWPEALVTDLDERAAGDGAAVLAVGRVQAWAAGPGLGTDDAAAALLEAVLSTDLPVVLDADATTVLAARPQLLAGRSGPTAPTLLTPHAGELARLLGAERADIEARRLEHAQRAAGQLGVTVLLKGSTTVVAEPGGAVRVNPTGTPWLATAGSGDVLTGLAGALLAGGLDALDAGSVAAWVHGLAGRLAAEAGPPTAYDVLAALPAALRDVREGEGGDRPGRPGYPAWPGGVA